MIPNEGAELRSSDAIAGYEVFGDGTNVPPLTPSFYTLEYLKWDNVDAAENQTHQRANNVAILIILRSANEAKLKEFVMQIYFQGRKSEIIYTRIYI